MHLPMALPMTSATSAIAWTVRRTGSAARRISCWSCIYASDLPRTR